LAARRDPASITGYLELHVEQGRRLVDAGLQIGIVTAIVGIGSARLAFLGQANHAGTTAMAARRDAGLGASAFVLASRERVLRDHPDCVTNVGEMTFLPGAFNIVPARAELCLEYRAPRADEMERLGAALIEEAHRAAARFGLGLEVERLGQHDPAPMDDGARAALAAAAEGLGLSHVSLASGAGHDAQSLAGLCPVGMVFVPSVDGASHSPREFTRWEDCVNGANVLLHAALRMAVSEG
jgi:N-carbamoyl-L-amino-acid hydrolase